MKSRCFNERDESFSDYGGRGITVCNRWLSFANFFEDMGKRPLGTSLDRIDNDGNYEPGNCRWTDQRTQNRNRRSNVWVEWEGERMIVVELASILGIDPRVLLNRVRDGWAIERWNEPVRYRKPEIGRKPYRTRKRLAAENATI